MMIATLGRWELDTDLSKRLDSHPTPPVSPELEQDAGDFIARQVLEKDSVFFEG